MRSAFKDFLMPTPLKLLVCGILEAIILVAIVLSLQNYYGAFGLYLVLVALLFSLAVTWPLTLLILSEFRIEKLLYLLFFIALFFSFFTAFPQLWYDRLYRASLCPRSSCTCLGVRLPVGPIPQNDLRLLEINGGTEACVGVTIPQQ